MSYKSEVRKSHNLTLEGLPTTPLTNPLAYSPKYLGSAKTEIDILVLLDSLIKDPKVSRISASVVLDTMTVTYKAAIDNLYKEVFVKHSPNGAPVTNLHRVYCQIISKTDESQGHLENKPVKYYFEVWRKNADGEIVEEHRVPISAALHLLYPTIKTFKVKLGGIVQDIDTVGAILLE